MGVGGYVGLMLLMIVAWAPRALNTPTRVFLHSLVPYGLGMTMSLAVLLSLRWALFPAPYLPFIFSMLLLAWVDIQFHSVRLVDLVLASVTVVSAMAPFRGWAPVMIALGWIGGFILLKSLVGWVYRQPVLGGADIWIIGLLLLALPMPVAWVAIYTAIGISAMVGMTLIVTGKKHRRSAMPMIPYIAIGLITALCMGEPIMSII